MIIPASGGGYGGHEECTVFNARSRHPRCKFANTEDEAKVYVCVNGHFLGKEADCKYCPACGLFEKA